MSITQSFISGRRGSIKLGVVVGLNTNTWGSKYLTFNINEETTYGLFHIVDKSKASTQFSQSFIGSGSLSLDNAAFTDANQTKLTPAFPGSGSLFVDIFSRNYDFKYNGRGVLRVNDDNKLTITVGVRRPYQGKGIFNFSGISNNSFTPKTYEGTGTFNFDGNSLSSNRKISVYGYYGDDANPGTSGLIIVGQQTLLTNERKTKSYVGFGAYTFSQQLTLRKSYGYSGNGNLILSDKGAESNSIKYQSNTQLFVISGISSENTIKIVPENTVSYNLNGIAETRVGISSIGIGTISIQGNSENVLSKLSVSRGLLRFVRHNVDNSFDTCDDIVLTSDNQHSASVSVVSNYSKTDGVFTFNGTSANNKITSYSYDGHNTYQLSGTYNDLKFSYSNVGFGTLYSLSTYNQSNIKKYIGLGSILSISGSSNSQTKKLPQSTILSIISGFAETKVKLDFSFIGNGLVGFNGFGDTRKISNYSRVGFVSFNLYGELVYPNIQFVPSPTSSGFINISGFSNESVSVVYEKTFGTFVQFSTSLESFSKSTYIGIGSIHMQETSNLTINNPFQISRTYVSII